MSVGSLVGFHLAIPVGQVTAVLLDNLGRFFSEVYVMNPKKELLIKSAARLYSLGLDLGGGARERLKELVAQGVSYSSAEKLEAYDNFTQLDAQWKELERQHLELRDEILREDSAKQQ